jgi:DNA-directed RNA polymerase subunit RPC12/RpoP
MIVCIYCSASFRPTSARPQVRCPDCRRRGIKPTSPRCRQCDTLMAFSPNPDRATCHPCRRKRNEEARAEIRSNPRAIPYRKRSTSARGYGYEHQKARREFLAAFEVGDPCVRCDDPILDITDVHLDHADDRSTYLGLAHSWCNVAAGARRGGAPRRLRDRVCDGCGLTFHPKQRSQWLCSRACVSHARRAA